MIVIYGMKKCGYCVNLKTKLVQNNIQFIYRDIDEYKEEFNKIIEKTKNDLIPVILVEKNILVPSISFNTIDEAIDIIKNLIN